MSANVLYSRIFATGMVHLKVLNDQTLYVFIKKDRLMVSSPLCASYMPVTLEPLICNENHEITVPLNVIPL